MGNIAEAQAPAGAGAALQRGLVSGPPDPTLLDSYLAVHSNNTASIYLGYVDLGQGGPTALCQVAADELDLDFNQISIVRNDTFTCTNGFTAASRTAGIGGVETRVAAAEARRVLLGLASERLKAPVQDLTVAKGVVSVKGAPGRSVTYGELLGDKPFNRKFEPVRFDARGAATPRTNTDVAPLKSPSDYKVVGTRVPRPDMHDKVRGTYRVHAACSRSGHAPRSRGVAAGPVRRVCDAESRQRRRVVDQGHPGRSNRAQAELRRRRR